MNIPDNILQAAIDAACEKVTEAPGFLLACSEKEYPDDWAEEVPLRLVLAKNFLAAIAPHLAPAGVGEYTDEAGLVPVATPEPEPAGQHGPSGAPPMRGPGLILEPEPAEEVPLGPEDCPPGSVLKAFSWGEHEWQLVSHLYSDGVLLEGFPTSLSWTELNDNWQINTSIPDTGRWDATAWRKAIKRKEPTP